MLFKKKTPQFLVKKLLEKNVFVKEDQTFIFVFIHAMIEEGTKYNFERAKGLVYFPRFNFVLILKRVGP